MIDSNILKAVKGHTHPNYSYTVEYAKKLNQIITGRDIDDLLIQFNPNESEAAFKQRKRITQQITPSVSKNLIDVYLKVPRSTSATKLFNYPNEEAQVEFTKILNSFYGNQSFDDFCSNKFIKKNWLDPNGFIVIEWKAFDNTKERANPYPFMVSSEMAVDYVYENNILQYLIVKQTIDEADRYTCYYKDYTIVWQQVKDVKAIQGLITSTEPIEFKSAGVDYITVNNKVYMIIMPENHNLGIVPAFRIGYIESDAYEGTMDSIIQPCMPYMMKSIKAVSEMDLTQSLHCFPQKFAYAPPCPKCHGMTPDIDECKHCGGTGQDVHTTAGDIVLLKLPRDPNKDTIVDLSQLIHYEYPPIDGIEWQDKYIKSLTAACKETMFNTDIYSRQEIAETATGKNISLQNVYDTLYPFAMHYSDFWEWGVEIISKVTEIKVNATLNFSKDFKFKTKDDYIAELKAAKEAGASPEIIASIETEIAKIDLEGNQDAMNVYAVKRMFMPFTGKTENQIMSLIATLPNNNYYKVLWIYFDEIFEQLEQENKPVINNQGEVTKEGFYKLNYTSQKTLLDAKVAEFISLYSAKMPVL